MSLWPRHQPDPASDRPDASAAGLSASGREVGPRAAAAPEERADDRDRPASQSLVAAKQFDIYGLIG